ncbi:hypothetical protein BpHYR1_019611 [Brachionus plicatilis]|uniref:Uncharacterized protein n=1 Tax=Brachionus plicatilis TaxID=10195 RepID=A0A3M7Q5A6_BRAPC|nr:hypothetical protein BpHYR1_019611 [Brachionus plicatilis]
MMYPDTDSSNTTSSEDTEPMAPRQTRPISPSECNKAAFVQQTVKNSKGKNRDYQIMVEGLQLTEATQYITQLDSVKWTRADTRKIQEHYVTTTEIIYENEEEEEINHVELRISAGVDTTQPKRDRLGQDHNLLLDQYIPKNEIPNFGLFMTPWSNQNLFSHL